MLACGHAYRIADSVRLACPVIPGVAIGQNHRLCDCGAHPRGPAPEVGTNVRAVLDATTAAQIPVHLVDSDSLEFWPGTPGHTVVAVHAVALLVM